jgi:hypothetical protein
MSPLQKHFISMHRLNRTMLGQKSIIGDNVRKAGWSWGCFAAIDSKGRTIWIVDAHRDDGKRFVAVASANRSTACCNARMAARPRSDRSVPLIERDRALELRSTPTRAIECPDCHKAPPAQATAPMLNSARRHCTSPRRGRRGEWSGQRPGIERLHFRPRLFCRRCACDAS